MSRLATMSVEELAKLSPEQIAALAKADTQAQTPSPTRLAPTDAGQMLSTDVYSWKAKSKAVEAKLLESLPDGPCIVTVTPLGHGHGYSRPNRDGVCTRKVLGQVGGGRDAVEVGSHPGTGNPIRLSMWIGEYLPAVDHVKFDAKTAPATSAARRVDTAIG